MGNGEEKNPIPCRARRYVARGRVRGKKGSACIQCIEIGQGKITGLYVKVCSMQPAKVQLFIPIPNLVQHDTLFEAPVKGDPRSHLTPTEDFKRTGGESGESYSSGGSCSKKGHVYLKRKKNAQKQKEVVYMMSSSLML